MSLRHRRFALSPNACDALWTALMPLLESVTERSLDRARFTTQEWIDAIRPPVFGPREEVVELHLGADAYDNLLATHLFRETLVRAYTRSQEPLSKPTRRLLGQVLSGVDELLNTPVVDRLAHLVELDPGEVRPSAPD